MADRAQANTTITFQVSCTSESNSIEIEVVNANSGCFQPGTDVEFYIYTVPRDMTLTANSTLGSVNIGGFEPREVPGEDEENDLFVEFVGSKEATVSRPVVRGLTHEWVGYNLGSVSLKSGTETVLEASGGGPDKAGVAKISYVSEARKGILSGVSAPSGDLKEFPVVVFIRQT